MTLEELERKFDARMTKIDDNAKMYAAVAGVAAYAAAIFTLKPKEEEEDKKAVKAEETPTQYVYRRYRRR